MKTLVSRFVLNAAFLASVGNASFAMADENWPQWRGPNRDGHAAPQALLKSWPVQGPKLAWSFGETGAGYSSVTVADGQIFTLGKINDRAVAICLDSKTGAKTWTKDFGNGVVNDSYNGDWGDGPRSSPTVDGEFVYCLSDLGVLACLDRRSGSLVWSKDFVKDFGGKVPYWGYSESVLIDGDRVIATPGSASGAAFIVGLDKKTGEKVWESKCSYEAQYVSIIKANFGGIPVYLTATKPGLVGVHAETGEELFNIPKTGNPTAVIPTPIVSGNRIYHSSGYGAGNVAIDIKVENGKLSTEISYAKNKESMENHHGGFVLHDGTIFGFSKAFRGVWMAQDLKTGDVLWSKKVGNGKSGSIGFADDMLYCYDDGDGICYLAKPSKTGWEPAGQVKLPEITAMNRKKGAIWAHPIIADKKLFIRDQEKLFAFDIGQ
jgi:outer membrane protein assembly factor BamB